MRGPATQTADEGVSLDAMLPLHRIPKEWLNRDPNDRRKGILQFHDGKQALALLPRQPCEPYASRWFFNELIYCEIAKYLEVPAHPAGVFSAGDDFGLYRFRYGDRIAPGFRSRSPVDQAAFKKEGYNLREFHEPVSGDCFTTEAILEMKKLLLLDQLLWMLDRRPHNLLAESAAGKFLRMRSIDHEHCLALDGDPDHSRPPANVDLSRCHPTQMTHFIDVSSEGRESLLNDARALRNRFSVDDAGTIAEEIRVFLIRELHLSSPDTLNEHVRATLDLFRRLWNTFEDRVGDLVNRYAPLLWQHGKRP